MDGRLYAWAVPVIRAGVSSIHVQFASILISLTGYGRSTEKGKGVKEGVKGKEGTKHRKYGVHTRYCTYTCRQLGQVGMDGSKHRKR